MRFASTIWLAVLCVAFSMRAADTAYKQVTVHAGTNFVRIRLPLTDVTGKVRVKEKTASGFGLPVAPTRTSLGKKHYLEWQIGYDSPDTNSPSLVPQIRFIRNGEIKYGHELTQIIYDCVRTGLLSTNDLIQEITALKAIVPAAFEENQPVEVETETNNTPNGFQRTVQRVPQFTKATPHGWVQIQLKQKQRAVGYQAMVYVCLPMNEVLTMTGEPRPPGPAKSKETVYYDFTCANAAFLLDTVHAFGLASQQHNADIREILEQILRASTSAK